MATVLLACSSGGEPKTEPETPISEPEATRPTDISDSNLPGRIVNILDLRTGECFKTPTDTRAVREVEVVPCSGRAEYRLVGRVNVALNGDYPGETYFNTQAGSFCPPTTTVNIAPGPTTWAEGDRAILCVQKR